MRSGSPRSKLKTEAETDSDCEESPIPEISDSKMPPEMKEIRIDLASKDKPLSLPKLKMLCLDLSSSSGTVQLTLFTIGVFIFYLVYGYMQELIFRLPGMKPFGWSMTLVQFFVCALVGFGESTVVQEGGAKRRIPLLTYIQLAFYTVATMGLSNASLGYLNYPTQVIFKSCKLIPVMIGGIIIQGKRYNFIDFTASVFMSFGLISFSLVDNKLLPNFHIKGYLMISGALIADAIIGNVQEKAMKAHHAATTEVVLYSYSIGSLYILILTIFTGEFMEAFRFFSKHPLETYGYVAILATVGYFGINIVLTLVREFGALVAVTVTTCRKAITIVLSFMLFTKPFSIEYLFSGAIVILGIYLNVYSKNRHKMDKRIFETLQLLKSKFKPIYKKFLPGDVLLKKELVEVV